MILQGVLGNPPTTLKNGITSFIRKISDDW